MKVITCIDCKYRNNTECRRFPPCNYRTLGAVICASSYPVVYNQLATAIPEKERYTEACFEWKYTTKEGVDG